MVSLVIIKARHCVSRTRGSAYSRIIPRIWYTPACLLTSLRRDIYVNTL